MGNEEKRRSTRARIEKDMNEQGTVIMCAVYVGK